MVKTLDYRPVVVSEICCVFLNPDPRGNDPTVDDSANHLVVFFFICCWDNVEKGWTENLFDHFGIHQLFA